MFCERMKVGGIIAHVVFGALDVIMEWKVTTETLVVGLEA